MTQPHPLVSAPPLEEKCSSINSETMHASPPTFLADKVARSINSASLEPSLLNKSGIAVPKVSAQPSEAQREQRGTKRKNEEEMMQVNIGRRFEGGPSGKLLCSRTLRRFSRIHVKTQSIRPCQPRTQPSSQQAPMQSALRLHRLRHSQRLGSALGFIGLRSLALRARRPSVRHSAESKRKTNRLTPSEARRASA